MGRGSISSKRSKRTAAKRPRQTHAYTSPPATSVRTTAFASVLAAGTAIVAKVQPMSPEANAIVIDSTPVSRSALCSTEPRYSQNRSKRAALFRSKAECSVVPRGRSIVRAAYASPSRKVKSEHRARDGEGVLRATRTRRQHRSQIAHKRSLRRIATHGVRRSREPRSACDRSLDRRAIRRLIHGSRRDRISTMEIYGKRGGIR